MTESTGALKKNLIINTSYDIKEEKDETTSWPTFVCIILNGFEKEDIQIFNYFLRCSLR